WTLPESASRAGYEAALTAEGPRSGQRSALLRSTRPASGAGFGNLMQTIDAAPFRGKLVRFAGMVRTRELKDKAQVGLWLRIDRTNNRRGAFDNMGDRPITATEWTKYEILAEVESDAEAINFGILLAGDGSVWLSDCSIESELLPNRQPPRALNR